jgi:hypothetical protein
MGTPTELYQSDFYEWALTNAHLLRNGQISEIDIQHIADELEDMGQKEKRELRSQLKRLIVHLLKWQFQSEKKTRSWRDTIINSREEIEDILDNNRTLGQMIPSFIENLYPKCVTHAIRETNLKPSVFPKTPPFTKEQILSETFWPEAE